MGFRWNEIRGATLDTMAQIVRAQIIEQINETGGVDLEDAYTHLHEGGGLVFPALSQMTRNPELFGLAAAPRFKFKVLCLNANGDTPKPGATFSLNCGPRETYYGTDGRMHAMNTRQYESMKNTFKIHHRPEDNPDVTIDYKLDDECCISVHFDQAVAILCNLTQHSGREEKMVVYRKDFQGQDTDVVITRQHNWLVKLETPTAVSDPVAVAAGYRRK